MQSWVCRHICPRRCLETVGACPSCGNPICRPKVMAPPSSSATQTGAHAERGSGCANLPECDVGAALLSQQEATGNRRGPVSLITKVQPNSAMLQSHRHPRGWRTINKYNFLRKGGFRLERVFTTTLKKKGGGGHRLSTNPQARRVKSSFLIRRACRIFMIAPLFACLPYVHVKLTFHSQGCAGLSRCQGAEPGFAPDLLSPGTPAITSGTTLHEVTLNKPLCRAALKSSGPLQVCFLSPPPPHTPPSLLLYPQSSIPHPPTLDRRQNVMCRLPPHTKPQCIGHTLDSTKDEKHDEAWTRRTTLPSPIKTLQKSSGEQ